jgi:hypothetical protein
MMLTIVWDVDDVLNDLMYQWFTHSWLVAHPGCRCRYADLSANPPHECLGTTRDEYLHSLDEFRKTDRAQRMRPSPEILNWLRNYGSRFRHVALTARPLESAPDLANWVLRHFGAWIRTFGVVPTRFGEHEPVYDRNKAEYLRWFRSGDILVDDSMENIRQAEELGLKALLYPQPWNKSTLTNEMVLQKLTEWAEVS